MFINHLNLQKVMFINHLNLQKVSKNNPEMLARMRLARKFVFLIPRPPLASTIYRSPM